MKAFVQTKYGPPEVLQLQEVDKPVPGSDELLVKVQAVSLNAYDWHFLLGSPFIMRSSLKAKNNILGADIAGRVEAVGANVTRFKPGDEVFGDIGSCGSGGFGEYALATEKVLALKPAGLSFEQAAAVPMAGMTALQGLRDYGKIQAGHKVLINGAAGGVGTFAVQIASAYGAEVTAVCSARNLEQARALGAAHVVDYAKADVTRSGQRFDIILAANGYHWILDYRRSLAPGGNYAMAGGTYSQMFQAVLLGPLISKFGDRKMQLVSAKISTSDVEFLRDWILAGKIRPVIDRTFSFAEIPDAMRYLITGHARGKIVVSF